MIIGLKGGKKKFNLWVDITTKELVILTALVSGIGGFALVKNLLFGL